MIGDPSGRSSERVLLTEEDIASNVASIKKQLVHLLDFEVKTNPAKLVNNVDWLGKLSAFDLLRNVGKYFTVNYMLAKDSVKAGLPEIKVFLIPNLVTCCFNLMITYT